MNQQAHPVQGSRIPFLAGRGEMAECLRGHDWTTSTLGVPDQWPQSLRTAVSLMLNSKYPMFIAWGPALAFLYNDGYKPILGGKHPAAIGQPFEHIWAEIWADIRPLIDRALAGEATWSEDLQLIMQRRGYSEEVYFTFSYSPVHDESGGIGGMFCACTETTKQVLGERRAALVRDLTARLRGATSVEDVWARSAEVLDQARLDLPFTLFYSATSETQARLVFASGNHSPDSTPPVLELEDAEDLWPVGEALRSGDVQIVDDVPTLIGPVLSTPWPELVQRACVLPIKTGGHAQPCGCLIAGLSARRELDSAYRDFIDLVASQLAAAMTEIQALDSERRRTAALAEIDRAKTAFFTNISHEFRTPLTLMMGPIEDVLLEQDPPLPRVQRERLSTAHRNSLRLLRLVNTLLDFSRIEAGRSSAAYEPLDLSALTASVASTFASAFERAGLVLAIECPPLPHPVYADRDMWEKVVLNLLSNAFKFTFRGGVTVRMTASGGGAQLYVQDTGVGVPQQELPRMFERFHRIAGQESRTYEGSGIGLALIQELVRLHGGSIHAESEVGRGTTFLVTLPFGAAHLPADRIIQATDRIASSARPRAYVEEALSWLPSSTAQPRSADTARDLKVMRIGTRRPRVLIADDNADMRDYVSGLLSDEMEIQTAANGRAALALLHEQRPDLLLSDVMMPELDGFGLLQAIRSDERLKDLPVILLSARAGEEARVVGANAGANDYLTKPFSARELVARVRSNIEIARVRHEMTGALAESEARFRNMAENAPVMLWVTEPDGHCTYLNQAWYAFTGQTPQEAEGYGWLSVTHPEDRAPTAAVFADANARHVPFRIEYRLRRRDGEYRWAIDSASPRFSAAGAFLGYIGSVIDITERKDAEQLLQRSNELLAAQVTREVAARTGAEEALRQAQKTEALGQLTGGIAHDFNNMLVAVIGNLDLLQRRLQRGDRDVGRFIDNALEGASRAANLTQRLLTFARQQAMAPEVIDVNLLIVNMSDLLHRTLGETVRIETVLAAGLWRVYTDANQLESALVNLAVNARDAMPEGGKLTIETNCVDASDEQVARNKGVPCGQYVTIAVADTGSGMSAQVLARAFDPFFTTKAVGKGTGLGLSQVHGFVHQSQGHVQIHSKENLGTTVKVYLPRSRRADVAAVVSDDRALPRAKRDTLVLVVEDEEHVRQVTVESLRELSYRVLEASDAKQALEVLSANPDIDLLFTDVVMPDMNGRKLAEEALRSRPALKVLYTTGYARDAIVHNGVVEPGVNLIGKPFNLEQLARKIAALLER